MKYVRVMIERVLQVPDAAEVESHPAARSSTSGRSRAPGTGNGTGQP
jgi:hypothetical protein